jgi:hypothetical protein
LALSVLFTWLLRKMRIDREPVGLRPHREFVAPVTRARAFALAVETIERTIGASIYRADEPAGTIEAAFGLVNHERLFVTLEAAGDEQTRIIVEAFYPAGLTRPQRSQAVEVLADTLESRIGT